ncbi:MAG TPA: hypothetical protein VGM06_24435 [Polyangiaceae bacterium]|jgi:hypothetical protein
MSIAVSSRRFAVAFALAGALCAPSIARAQADADQPAAGTPKPKPAKKPAKKKKPASADDTPAPAPVSADDATTTPPKDATKAAPDASKAADADSAAPADAKVIVAPDEVAPKEPDANDDTNTFEDPNTRYYFVGARYRGTVIPQFIENLFVDDGGTVYSNSIGAELDIRKGGQSMIPWIVYADYGMGDTLFHEKNATPTGGTGPSSGDAANFTVVNSSLKAIYLGLDELWSVPLDKSHHWDFEFGFGVGVGVIFGNLQNNWVYQNNNGNLSANGVNYFECQQFNNAPSTPSCTLAGHTGATTLKVGGYVEKNWFNGGAVPVFFPHISFPQLSIRYKPIKQMEARVGVGFSLTGFWFALSADYGLESTDKKPVKPASASLGMHDML